MKILSALQQAPSSPLTCNPEKSFPDFAQFGIKIDICWALCRFSVVHFSLLFFILTFWTFIKLARCSADLFLIPQCQHIFDCSNLFQAPNFNLRKNKSQFHLTVERTTCRRFRTHKNRTVFTLTHESSHDKLRLRARPSTATFTIGIISQHPQLARITCRYPISDHQPSAEPGFKSSGHASNFRTSTTLREVQKQWERWLWRRTRARRFSWWFRKEIRGREDETNQREKRESNWMKTI